MKVALRFVLDRDRSQRGSVLSAVLIITAFIAILAGALMTTLSTNFVLSADLMARTVDQATIQSSMELAIDTFQGSPLISACPNLATPPTLNKINASVSYLSCALVTDSTPAAIPIANPVPVAVDGAFVSLPGLLPGKGNEYLAADSAGTLFAYEFGHSTPAWSLSMQGTPAAQPVAIAIGGGAVADLVPITDGSGNHGVAMVEEAVPGQPSLKCAMSTDGNAAVTATPAGSRNPNSIVYFGDRGGTLYAFDASASGSCGKLVDASVGSPIVSGPVVFPGTNSKSDRLFFVTSDSNSSELVQYRYTGNNPSLSSVASLQLPWPNAVGIDVDSASLPSRIAITFANGGLATALVSSSFNMTLTQTASVPGGNLNKPPSWCMSCLGGAGAIGVAGPGGMFMYDTSLSLRASYSAVPMVSSPSADSGGDWFVGSADGTLYELLGLGTMRVAQAYQVGSGAIASSPVVARCPAGLCAYFGASGSNAYLIQFDQRDAVMSACVVVQGSCAPSHSRLWTHVIVGAAGNPRAVRVLGFAYYSP